MKTTHTPGRLVLAMLLVLACGFVGYRTAKAQDSSLFSQETIAAGRRPLTLAEGSYYYRQLPPPKKLQVHDLVTILVDEKSKAKSSGNAQRTKTASYDAVLTDWIKLIGLKAIGPDGQADGDPRIQGNLKQDYQAKADLETSESLHFEIQAEVVEIRPNGNLVLEARKSLRKDNENWEYTIMGLCRPDDVQPNNTVLSKNLAELMLYQRERGMVHDGYRRGWLTRFYDTWNPF